MAWLIPIPMWIVTGENEGIFRVHPAQIRLQIFFPPGYIGHGLRTQADMPADILAGQAFDPRRVVAQRAPIEIEVPHKTRQPESIHLDKNKVQILEFLKHALHNETRDMSLCNLGPCHPHLEIIGGISRSSGRCCKTSTFSPEMNRNGQSVSFTGFVNGMVVAVAKRHAGTRGHHNLHKIRIGTQAINFLYRKLRIYGANMN